MDQSKVLGARQAQERAKVQNDRRHELVDVVCWFCSNMVSFVVVLTVVSCILLQLLCQCKHTKPQFSFAGTRSKKRGIDESGACANYVETEQVLRHMQWESDVAFVTCSGSQM